MVLPPSQVPKLPGFAPSAAPVTAAVGRGFFFFFFSTCIGCHWIQLLLQDVCVRTVSSLLKCAMPWITKMWKQQCCDQCVCHGAYEVAFSLGSCLSDEPSFHCQSLAWQEDIVSHPARLLQGVGLPGCSICYGVCVHVCVPDKHCLVCILIDWRLGMLT